MRRFAEKLSFPPVKNQQVLQRFADICGDDESAQKLCRKKTTSRLVNFPSMYGRAPNPPPPSEIGRWLFTEENVVRDIIQFCELWGEILRFQL